MKVDFDTSVSSVFQQLLTGGNFTGVELGRPAISHGAGNSQVLFRGRNLGSWMDNAFFVELKKPHQDVADTVAIYDEAGKKLTVVLKTTAGVITATAKDVADAVQKLAPLPPILVTYGGTGLGVVTALASTTFASTLDPTNRRNVIYSFEHAVNNGGLFNFNNNQNLIVKHFEAKLGASVAWTLDLVQMDEGMRIITAETTRLAGATSADVLVPLNYVLNPLRGLLFTAPATGVARVIAHREAAHPIVQ